MTSRTIGDHLVAAEPLPERVDDRRQDARFDLAAGQHSDSVETICVIHVWVAVGWHLLIS